MIQVRMPYLESKQLRFIFVGAINTATDLSIYTLAQPHIGIFIANLISTTAGMIVGYLLHRSYTFQATHKRSRGEVVLFFGLTIIGLWVLQPIIIYLATGLLANTLSNLPLGLVHIIPKCLAIGVGLIWNYLCYNYIVFKTHSINE